jgi:hypothetical protein
MRLKVKLGELVQGSFDLCLNVRCLVMSGNVVPLKNL